MTLRTLALACTAIVFLCESVPARSESGGVAVAPALRPHAQLMAAATPPASGAAAIPAQAAELMGSGALALAARVEIGRAHV